MLLDVKKIINVPGERIAFQFDMDLSDVDFGGRYPAQNPVVVTGDVRNVAGMLLLSFTAETTLHAVCDRCLQEFERVKTIHYETMVATALEDEDNDEILFAEDGLIDMDELARTTFILEMDLKTLCREDCKGLCSGCGVNLNQGSCICQKEADPRLAVLAQLLHREDNE